MSKDNMRQLRFLLIDPICGYFYIMSTILFYFCLTDLISSYWHDKLNKKDLLHRILLLRIKVETCKKKENSEVFLSMTSKEK